MFEHLRTSFIKANHRMRPLYTQLHYVVFAIMWIFFSMQSATNKLKL